jgi:hypothetical protein
MSFLRSLKFLFATWLIIAVVALGSTGLAMKNQLTSDPQRVIIIVDSSFEAGKDWEFLTAELRRIGQRPYTRFKVLTEKTLAGDWQQEAKLNSVTPFAPRSWTEVQSALPSMVKSSDEVIVLTNAQDLPAEFRLDGVRVVRP